jgi:hypothetical protein
MMRILLHAADRHLIGTALVAVLVVAGAQARAADPADPTWPCQQRKVATISPGQVWAGPPIEAVGTGWSSDPAVADLARRLAARRTDLEEAKTLIAGFADAAGADRNQRLTALAAGVLSLINSDRASIIAGIERYAKRQQQLAEKIERQTTELQALPVDGTEAEQSQRADLLEIQNWDTRIFQEREKSLTYVCELPVQLERRAFALGREMQSHLAP